MLSLQNAFSENRGLRVFQNLILSLSILCTSSEKYSILDLRKRLTEKFLYLLYNFLILLFFSSVNLNHYSFLRVLFVNFALFTLTYFCPFGTCVFRTNAKAPLKCKNSALFMSVPSNLN